MAHLRWIHFQNSMYLTWEIPGMQGKWGSGDGATSKCATFFHALASFPHVILQLKTCSVRSTPNLNYDLFIQLSLHHILLLSNL